jgi:hypothetical protein
MGLFTTNQRGGPFQKERNVATGTAHLSEHVMTHKHPLSLATEKSALLR